jgi:hypothetical protein
VIDSALLFSHRDIVAPSIGHLGRLAGGGTNLMCVSAKIRPAQLQQTLYCTFYSSDSV